MSEKANNTITVPLENEWSQRPQEAFLHARDEDGSTKLWITGLNIGNYESLVGPERAERHRQSFAPLPQRQGGFVTRLVRRFF
jgi:hypothetical protein